MIQETPWFSSYPEGMPHTIDDQAYTSLVDWVDHCAAEYGDATAFINFGASLSYKKLHELSVHFAAYLQAQPLKKGSRVAIMMPNILQYVVAMVGILRAGMVVVNVNPLYTVSEVSHQLNDAGAEAIIILEQFAITLQRSLPDTPTLHTIIITKIGDLLGPVKGNIFNIVVRYVKKLVPSYHLPKAQFFKQALKEAGNYVFQPVTVGKDDIAFLQYTGGTTGVPKAAMLTHRNMLANILQCATWVGGILNRQDMVVAALPMYHIFSLTVCCLTFMSLGARCLLITNPRDISSFISTLRRVQTSVFVGLNTLFIELMQHPQFPLINFSKLKLTVSGGMAMQHTVAERWQQLTKCVVTEGYGLTEASPVVTINPVMSTTFSGSIGLPIPSTLVKICDDHGMDLPLKEVGELWVQGPQVMLGYWQKPNETALTLTQEGWLKTGDLAYLDEKGFVYVVDRKKDMICVSGFNVYPNQVEDVIAACPGVKEVAVVGVPCDKTGEAVKAFIIPADPTLTEAEVKLYCRQYLTGYKIPKFIQFCETLPKSAVGKVLRRQLK